MPIKTSQRTSGGLYIVNDCIGSAEMYSDIEMIAYADPELDIRWMTVSDRRIEYYKAMD